MYNGDDVGSWRERAIELKETNSWTETAKRIRSEYFPEDDENLVYNRIRSHIRRHAKPVPQEYKRETDITGLLKKRMSLEELSKQLGSTERVTKARVDDLIEQGVCIEETDGFYQLSKIPHSEPQIIDKDWNGDKIIRFGLLGDNQSGSKYTQITLLHEAYDFYKKEGITTIYHTGDITDGEDMRTGHKYECYVQGGDDHVAEVIKNYPQRLGIETEFITGNHDHSLIKHAGMNIGTSIAEKRKDLKYLGLSQAFINITPNCLLELRHPEDGTAYAISYKMQKMIEGMFGGEKPHILAVGHYHKAEYLPYRNVHSIQTGCLQAQTPWMRGKGIAAIMGYWLIEIHVNDDGQINRFKPEFMQCYKTIHNDYENWK